jgi:hypothetical protein
MSKIDEARAAGYSDDEILTHMTKNKPKLADALREGYSATEILSHLGGESVKQPVIKEEQPERGLGDAAWSGLKNLPRGIVNAVKGLGQIVANPGQAASATNDTLRGLAMKIPGADMSRLNPEDAARAQQSGNALANDYGETYGSWKGFKNKLATEPLGPMMDAATLGSFGLLGGVGKAVNALRPVEMGVNALASGGARLAGTVADIGRGPELAAGRIAREAAGSDLATIQAANRANPNAPAGLASGGVSGDTYQALAAKGTRPDMGAVAAQLTKDESDMMKFGSRLKEPERIQLEQRIREAKSLLDSVNLNAEQAVAGQTSLNQLVGAEGTRGVRIPEVPMVAKVIPGVRTLGTGIKFANGALDLIQMSGKFKTETLQKLADGMATGKSANELLATLPTSERSKLLQLLQSKPHWLTNPVTTGSLEGVNMLNQSQEQ